MTSKERKICEKALTRRNSGYRKTGKPTYAELVQTLREIIAAWEKRDNQEEIDRLINEDTRSLLSFI